MCSPDDRIDIRFDGIDKFYDCLKPDEMWWYNNCTWWMDGRTNSESTNYRLIYYTCMLYVFLVRSICDCLLHCSIISPHQPHIIRIESSVPMYMLKHWPNSASQENNKYVRCIRTYKKPHHVHFAQIAFTAWIAYCNVNTLCCVSPTRLWP